MGGDTTNIAPNTLTAILRAVCMRCPNCGKGSLFASYLKQVVSCSICDERFGHIRADDGPPWLTVLIVGHLVLPIIFTTGAHSAWPQWLSSCVWVSVSCVLMYLILPRAKGLFIGILWKNNQPST
jgi:uncharacterized protein (DUF983 family)